MVPGVGGGEGNLKNIGNMTILHQCFVNHFPGFSPEIWKHDLFLETVV
jgi:hypothetical protein